jgi:hypothetical protein
MDLNQNKMKKTAVEWLEAHLIEYGFDLSLHKFELKQAKEMEKQQIAELLAKLDSDIAKELTFKPKQERMYSEQEVLQLLLRLKQTESYDNLYEWFEQFKKK